MALLSGDFESLMEINNVDNFDAVLSNSENQATSSALVLSLQTQCLDALISNQSFR